VSGEDITVEQVKEAARNMAQQQAQRYGANASMLMPFLIQQATQHAADQLIDRQALVTEAQHLGLKATPQEVKDDLQHGRYAGIFFREETSSARLSTRVCCSSTTLLLPCSRGREQGDSDQQAAGSDHGQRVGER